MSTSFAEEQLSKLKSIYSDTSLTSSERDSQIQRILLSTSPPPTPSRANGIPSMSPNEKLSLILSNLQETLDQHLIEQIVLHEDRPLKIYWGTATTGRPHCGYFVAMIQIASFLKAGCNVKILLADIHGFLDNLKAPIALVRHRAEYYKFVIVELMKAVGVPVDRLEFILGSSYQLTPEYQMDLLRVCTEVSQHDARRAGSEVVKQVEDAKLSGLIYPLMQCLDEQYLDVDVQFGGVDQRKIFTLAKEVLPKINYKMRAHLMNPMVPGLAGGKMSASDTNSKIDILDKPEVVKKKISKAHAVPKVVEGNGLLAFVEHVLLLTSALKTGEPRFEVLRHDKEPLIYTNIDEIKKDYEGDVLTPQDLKAAVTKDLTDLLAPAQKAFNENKEWQRVADLAYPPEQVKEKPKKTPKNKGTMYPGGGGGGAAKVKAQPDGSVEGKDKQTVDLGANAADAMKELNMEKAATTNGT